ncbi:MAG: hypothetical protein COA58_13340 [Bacteroidetes bacterium]|nr:MAG: hypothetical protein COA58_13340 [Bacteroidota bacterium]
MKFCTLVILLLYNVRVLSQDLIVKTLTPNDGLPSSEVYCVFQDTKGYLWIGTDNGLAKFDGKNYKVYTTDEGLPHNSIMNITEDRKGNLWVLTISNSLAYIKNDSVYEYPYELEVPNPQYLTGILTISVDENMTKWLYDENAGVLFKETENHLFKMMNDVGLSSFNVTYYTQRIGRNAIATIRTSNITKLPSTSSIGQPRKVEISNRILQVQNVILDYYTFHWLDKTTLIGLNKSGKFIKYSNGSVVLEGQLDVKNINKLYIDKMKNIWILSTEGVALYKDDNFIHSEVFFKNHSITDMLHDNEGNYWFSDQDRGLHLVHSINFRKHNLKKNGAEDKIATIKDSEDALYVSSIKGNIWKKKSTTNFKKYYKESRTSYDYYPFAILKNNRLFLPGGRIVSSNSVFSSEKNILNGYTAYKSIDIFNNQLWIGMTEGVAVSDLNGGNFRKIDTKFNLRSNATYLTDSSLWIGTLDGLYCYKQDTIHRLSLDNKLLSNRILCLTSYKNKLVIGTKGAGVLIYDLTTKSIVQISLLNGLPSNLIKSILIYENQLIIGTNKGLSILQFDINNTLKILSNYDINNSLPSNEINAIGSFNNRIWLGTNTGLVSFNIKEAITNTYAPPIYIDKLKTTELHEFNFQNRIELNSNERSILFGYHGIGFRAKSRLEYKYFLEGFDTDTLYTKSEEVKYTNLGPNTYTFHVWARNENGIWSGRPSIASFVIPEKLNEKFSFKLGVLLLVVLFGGALLMYIENRRRQTILNDLEYAELREHALAALMNPHFIYNSLSALQSLINKGNIAKSSRYLSQFSKLIRMNLTSIREGVVMLEDEIQRLKIYLEIEKLRLEDKLNYEVHFEENQDLMFVEIPAMIIQPFVENAIWHGILPSGKEGFILINIKLLENDMVEVRIKDNGVGLSAAKNEESKHHSSMSLEITKERFDLLSLRTGRECKFNATELGTNDGGGTLICLQFPIIT